MSFDVDSRLPWLTVFCSALALEMTALYFQYGMKLDPCVLCIYQRTAVAGIAIAGLIGALAPRTLPLRLFAYLCLGAAAASGVQLALEHIAVQAGETMNCAFFADFPAWLKLDEWFPAFFRPTGSCDEIQWQFLGQGMPQWMVVIFSAYIGALVYALAREAIRLRR